jgi:hypothetical protein
MNDKLTTGSTMSVSLADAVDEFTQRLNAGDRPNVHEFAERYPDCRETLETILHSLLAIRGNKSNDPHEDATSVPLPFRPIETYTIVEKSGIHQNLEQVGSWSLYGAGLTARPFYAGQTPEQAALAWSVEGAGSASSASQEKSIQLHAHDRDGRATIFRPGTSPVPDRCSSLLRARNSS